MIYKYLVFFQDLVNFVGLSALILLCPNGSTIKQISHIHVYLYVPHIVAAGGCKSVKTHR